MRGYKIFFLLLVFMACTKSGERPPDLIAKEKMASILIDLHWVEALIDNREMRADSALSVFTSMRNDVFLRFGTDSAIFRSSFEYYASNITELDLIYEAVLDSLNAEQAGLKSNGP